MDPLAKYLLANVQVGAADQAAWQQFSAELNRTRDLESTLQAVTLTPASLQHVVRNTRAMILEDDLKVFRQLVLRERAFPLVDLFAHLFRSTHQTISVVTTNYDRLAEYAANLVQSRVNTNVGFTDGYIRNFRLPVTAQSVHLSRQPRCVDVWKVHGSIDWFIGEDSNPLALPFTNDYPTPLQPLLVTPGVTKYQITHQEPFRTIITQADVALANARGFFCIGYGFNDIHIEPKLVRRAVDLQIPVVILARTLREGAKRFIANCRHDRVLGLERADSGTRAFSTAWPGGIVLPDSSLWELGPFLEAAIA
ncbi:MAG TPA: SIR2 family protein [Pirellulales bacterium]|nr:SIR2 family protein [Pirellulales bacterium]